MAICWKRTAPLAFHLCCFNFSPVIIVGVPFLFGVKGRMWNSIVLVPDHCLFIYCKEACTAENEIVSFDGSATSDSSQSAYSSWGRGRFDYQHRRRGRGRGRAERGSYSRRGGFQREEKDSETKETEKKDDHSESNKGNKAN